MADRSSILADAFRNRWPTEKDFREKRVVRANVADEIRRRLSKFGWCWLVGPPRSGKTTLACLTAMEETAESSKSARYIDLAEVSDDATDIEQIMPISQGRCFIIDNWHTRPSCHEHILARMRDEWKGGKFILVVTQFPGEDDTPDPPLPSLKPTKGEENTPIDITDWHLEIARGMICGHIERYIGVAAARYSPDGIVPLAASRGLFFDEEDYQQALVAPAVHKRIRGNLRFLSWRLKAWNPLERHLRDVMVGSVVDMVKQTLVLPCERWVGTLERVASLSQWEAVYRRAAGENPPEGIEALGRCNIVLPVETATTAWRMDSTDAYLTLLATSGDNWMQRSVALLKEYLKLVPDETPTVIASVFSEALEGTKTDIVCALLEDERVAENEKMWLVERIVAGELRFNYLKRIVGIILYDVTRNSEKAAGRAAIVAALLTNEIASAIGPLARSQGLQSLLWFLKLLDKDSERLNVFARAFLTAYGEENLRDRLQNSSSGLVQRTFLRIIGHFDLDLRARLRSGIQLQLRPFDTESFVGTLYGLEQGCVESGPQRTKKIDFLLDIDEDYLTTALTKDSRAAGHLQSLLRSALWLFPKEARRIAAIVPRVWPKLQLPQNDAVKLSYVLVHCWFANQDAARELADLFTEVRLSAFVNPRGLGRLLTAAEKTQPGVVQRWCEHEEDYLAQVVSSLHDEEGLDELLVPLAAFAPAVTTRLIEGCSAEGRRRLLEGVPSYGRWPRLGILSLSGVDMFGKEKHDMPHVEELVSSEPAQLILALYGIQSRLSTDVVRNTLMQFSHLPVVSPFVPLLLARHPLPWAPEEAVDMVRAILRAGVGPRNSALGSLVLAATLLQFVQWGHKQRFDPREDGHRALETAIHENLVRLEHRVGDVAVRAVVNGQHPSVRDIREKILAISGPLDRPLNLPQWDASVGVPIPVTELDFWRSKLIRAGKVHWSVDFKTEPMEVVFSFVDHPSEELLYGVIALPSPAR